MRKGKASKPIKRKLQQNIRQRKNEFTEKVLLRLIKSPLLRFFFKLYLKRKIARARRKERYVFRLDTVAVAHRYKRFNLRFISVRITRLYFINLQDYQFRKLFKKASKLTGQLETNYCYLLEGRIASIIYRTNLVVMYLKFQKLFVRVIFRLKKI